MMKFYKTQSKEVYLK